MTDRLIEVCRGPIDGKILVPGSKSLTNRALLAAALAEGESVLEGVLDSEDTRIMAEALRSIGFAISEFSSSGQTAVSGGLSHLKGFPADRECELYVGNSGVTARFLTALLSFVPGKWRIYGKERMHSRPMKDLLSALRLLGAEILSESGDDRLPVQIKGKPFAGGKVTVSGNLSSQYLSGLLMAAPLASGDTVIKAEGVLVSRPYAEMTIAVMKAFGVQVQVSGEQTFFVPSSAAYQPAQYSIEPDASAASYFLALPAVLGGRVKVLRLSRDSLQGDAAFAELLELMGCRLLWEEDGVTVIRDIQDGKPAELVGIDVDMNDISDTVQTLSVVALFAATPTRIRNVAHIRGKETDRISAVVSELRKFGVRVDEYDDGLQIWPRPVSELSGNIIETYDDHRMAMSFALAGLAVPGVVIRNSECTAKTYPHFFDDLRSLCR